MVVVKKSTIQVFCQQPLMSPFRIMENIIGNRCKVKLSFEANGTSSYGWKMREKKFDVLPHRMDHSLRKRGDLDFLSSSRASCAGISFGRFSTMAWLSSEASGA